MEQPERSGDGRRCYLGFMPANTFSHFLTHLQSWDVGLGVLLEMELAALPWDGREDGVAGGGHAGVGIADDEAGAVEAPGDQRGEEVAPVDFGLAEGDADAEDGAFAIGADADGDEHGAVAQEAAVAHFFIAGIEDEVRAGVQRALAPELEFDIELGGAGADLRGADLVAAEFLDDFSDLASGDSLDVHLLHCVHPCGAACRLAISLRSVRPWRA